MINSLLVNLSGQYKSQPSATELASVIQRMEISAHEPSFPHAHFPAHALHLLPHYTVLAIYVSFYM